METDLNSAAMPAVLPQEIQAEPVGNTWRGFGSSWFNQNAIDREEFQRAEQLANNSFLRQSALDTKAFERQKYLRDTAYQSTVEDLKKAGLNPILAYQNGASVSPSVSSGSSQSGRYQRGRSEDGLSTVFKMVAGLVTGLVGAFTDLKGTFYSADSRNKKK